MAPELIPVAEVAALRLRPSCVAVFARQPATVVAEGLALPASLEVAVAMLEGPAAICRKYLD
jgi:hypothetical protein